MVRFSNDERYVLSLFNQGSKFYYEGIEYVIELSGKPTTSQGEPKTDIYVRCKEVHNENRIEFKISFKKENADFLENKMTAERAEQIFGSRWQELISEFTQQIKNNFLTRPFIYKSRFGRTRAGSITLGWRFELVNKPGGELSDVISLTANEVLEVYAGRMLELSKRNARVNGVVVPESGVANTIINNEIDNLKTLQDAINNIMYLEEFATLNPDVYFACKALNYRTFEEKFDGNRPLAVYIDWDVNNTRLTPTVNFGNPLITRGNQVADQLKKSLNQLQINNTDDIISSNVSSMSFVHI